MTDDDIHRHAGELRAVGIDAISPADIGHVTAVLRAAGIAYATAVDVLTIAELARMRATPVGEARVLSGIRLAHQQGVALANMPRVLAGAYERQRGSREPWESLVLAEVREHAGAAPLADTLLGMLEFCAADEGAGVMVTASALRRER